MSRDSQGCSGSRASFSISFLSQSLTFCTAVFLMSKTGFMISPSWQMKTITGVRFVFFNICSFLDVVCHHTLSLCSFVWHLAAWCAERHTWSPLICHSWIFAELLIKRASHYVSGFSANTLFHWIIWNLLTLRSFWLDWSGNFRWK